MFVRVVALCYQHHILYCVMLTTECHNSHKHSQNPSTYYQLHMSFKRCYAYIGWIQRLFVVIYKHWWPLLRLLWYWGHDQMRYVLEQRIFFQTKIGTKKPHLNRSPPHQATKPSLIYVKFLLLHKRGHPTHIIYTGKSLYRRIEYRQD